MKTILRLTSQRAQVALAAALLLGCSLNVIVAAAHVARSGTAAAATSARWGQLPAASARVAAEAAATAPRAAGEGGPFRPDAVRSTAGRAS